MFKNKGILLVLFFFSFLALLLFWPIFAGQVNLNGNLLVSFYAPFGENLPFKNSGWDQLRIYFPFYNVTLDAIRNLQFPLWNPYAFSGHPHAADFQSAVFYPLNLFGLFLPQIEFWHLLRVTPTILASFFMFLYLKTLGHPELVSGSNLKIPDPLITKVKRGKQVRNDKGGGFANLACIFGAISFGFSPFILTWGEEVVMAPHSIVWLPLILWAVERCLALHSRSEVKMKSGLHFGSVIFAIISLSTAFSFLGGYMQTSIYMFAFIFAYLIVRTVSEPRSVKLFHIGSGMGRHIGRLVGIGGAFVLGVGIAALQILPSAELYFNAARSQITLKEQLFNFLLPIESLLTFFAPDFFGHPATGNFFRRGDAQYYEGILFVGIAVLVFAAYQIVSLFAHPRGARLETAKLHPGGVAKLTLFLAISAGVSILTVVDSPISKLFLSLPIPFLSTSIPNRVLFIPAFCLAVLAAFGFDRWVREVYQVSSVRYQVIRAVLVIGGVYAGILVVLGLVKVFGFGYFEHRQFITDVTWPVSARNLAIPLAVFVVTAAFVLVGTWKSKLKNIAAVGIIIVSFLHIFYFSQKYFSFSARDKVFPENATLNFIQENQGYFRSWGVGEARFENNFASQYGIYWPEGYDSLNNRSYGEFTYSMQGANLDEFIFRADAGLGHGKTAELLENVNRRRLLDMVGIKYVMAPIFDEEVMVKNNFKKVFPPSHEVSEGKFGVFENQTVMPRAFLASNYEGPPDVFGEEPKTVKEKSQREKERRALIPRKLLSEDFDFRNVLVLEKPSPVSAQFGQGNAEIVSYKPMEVVIATSSEEPKLLFLSDNWYFGWKATVDGDETEILRANYTFRAVPLVAGAHTVRFYYDPMSFKLGLIISIVSLGVLAIWVLAQKNLRNDLA